MIVLSTAEYILALAGAAIMPIAALIYVRSVQARYAKVLDELRGREPYSPFKGDEP